jgi:hypothetical protein
MVKPLVGDPTMTLTSFDGLLTALPCRARTRTK